VQKRIKFSFANSNSKVFEKNNSKGHSLYQEFTRQIFLYTHGSNPKEHSFY
jgi:hypothetical protein